MAASIGTWATLTNGSDPSGSPTIDAGSNRKFVLFVIGECDSNSLSVTVTVGGQSPSQTQESLLEIGGGEADIVCLMYIWNEAAIGAMSGTSISWSDGITFTKISWSTVTVQDTDQGTAEAQADSSNSATSVTCTWSTSTTSNDIIIGGVIADSANRAPMDTSLTARLSYSAADYAMEIGDASGGGGFASSVTMSNDGTASDLLGLAVNFAGVTSAGPVRIMREINEAFLS